MKSILIKIRAQSVWLVRISLINMLHHLILRHPRMYQGALARFKRHLPGAHKLCRHLLRRLRVIGVEQPIRRIRGNQEHALSPLAQRILEDLKSIVPMQSKD